MINSNKGLLNRVQNQQVLPFFFLHTEWAVHVSSDTMLTLLPYRINCSGWAHPMFIHVQSTTYDQVFRGLSQIGKLFQQIDAFTDRLREMEM